MPHVSEQQQSARTAALERLNTIGGWLEAEDVAAVAAETGLSEGTVKQIRKGARWNSEAVRLLIEKAVERQTYYETLTDSRLDEKTGKPILKASDESKQKTRKE